jgi:hypothetical protein
MVVLLLAADGIALVLFLLGVVAAPNPSSLLLLRLGFERLLLSYFLFSLSSSVSQVAAADMEKQIAARVCDRLGF